MNFGRVLAQTRLASPIFRMLSLTGISGDSLFIQLLKPTSFTPILALIGAVMHLFLKDVRKKDTGEALLGFAVGMGCQGFWYGDALAGFMPFVIGMLYYLSGRWRKAK